MIDDPINITQTCIPQSVVQEIVSKINAESLSNGVAAMNVTFIIGLVIGLVIGSCVVYYVMRRPKDV